MDKFFPFLIVCAVLIAIAAAIFLKNRQPGSAQ